MTEKMKNILEHMFYEKPIYMKKDDKIYELKILSIYKSGGMTCYYTDREKRISINLLDNKIEWAFTREDLL